MASNVNTRFVVILSVALVIVFGGVGLAGFIAFQGRGERNVAKADALMDLGQYEEAAKLYERSVGRDRTRADWLEKWFDALGKSTPDVRAEYEQSYGFYRNILRQLALLRAQDVDAQIRYIKELDRFIRATGSSLNGLDHLTREIDERVRDLGPNDPELPRLLRYRGLAIVDQMTLLTIDEDKRKQALADIEAAIRIDPTDWEASLGQVRWHLAESDRAVREGRVEISGVALADARRLMNEFLTANPGHPEGMLMSFVMEQAVASRTSVSIEAKRVAGERLLGLANEVVAAAVATPAEQLRPAFVQRLVAYLSRGLGASGLGPLEEVLDRAIEQNPNDAAGLMLAKGGLLMEKGELEASMEELQKVVDLPDLPVSLDGLLIPARRQSARAIQVDAALRKWGNAKQEGNDVAANAALEQAKKYRDSLADSVGVQGRNMLLLRDAKIAMAEARFAQAVQDLSELRRTDEGQSIEVIQLLAQSLEQQASLGEARRLYMELAELSPNLPGVHAKIGELNVRLGNMEEARANYRVALNLNPQNEEYARRIGSIDEALRVRDGVGAASAGAGGAAQSNVPTTGGDLVVRAILEARARRAEQDVAGERTIIENAIKEAPEDTRLVREYVSILLRDNERDEAVAYLETKLAGDPGNRNLRQMLIMAQADDPLEGRLAIIAASDLTPVDKAVERFETYLGAGRNEEAEKAIAEAEAIDPNNARVLDYLFIIALNKGDKSRYTDIARRAAEKDLDNMGGLLYQARIELVEGRNHDAVQTLERAVKLNEYMPPVWRLLGQARMNVGRTQDALVAYKRAYEGKPDDIATARDYARALAGANRGSEALGIVNPETGVLKYGKSDEDLIRLWLELEARYGSREVAMKVRKQRFEADPERLENSLALNALYLQDQNWEASHAIISALETNPQVDATTIAALKANLESRQGNVDAGRDALRAHIDATPESERSAQQYLTLAEYLIQNARTEEGTAVLMEARAYQDPALQEAERRLGDLAFARATSAANTRAMLSLQQAEAAAEMDTIARDNYREALDAYNRVLAAGPDDAVAKRAAETALRLEDAKEAERILAPVAAKTPEDMQVLSLRANIARSRGDTRAARQLYNRAVELYPTDPNTFVQRALFSAEDPTLLSDALEDLTQAVRLRPTLVNAWLTRASLLKQNGRVQDSLVVLREAVTANPANDDLRILLVREFWNSGNQDLAQAEVLRFAAERPNDLKWLEEAAGFMANVGRMREAGDLYEKMYAIEPTPEIAGKIIFTRLQGSTEPNRQDIRRYLVEFEKLAIKDMPVTQLIPTHMLRARARAFLTQEDSAKADLDKALALVKDDSGAARFFAEELLMALGGSREKVVEYLEDRAKKQTLAPFLRVVILRAKLESGVPTEGLLAAAKALEAQAMDTMTTFELMRLTGLIAYVAREHRMCAEYYAKALELAPNDVQLNNDLAYTMAVDLRDPEAALPYALKAVELTKANPNSPVLDTLGWIQYLAKDSEAAEKSLTQAVEVAKTADQSLIALCHLGIVQAESGNMEGARRSLQGAERAARDFPAAAEAFKDYLDQLRKAVE